MEKNKCYLRLEDFNYSINDCILFEQANLDINFNKLIIEGRNGCGKSTILNLIHKSKIHITDIENNNLTTAFANQNQKIIGEFSSLENAYIFNVDKLVFTDLVEYFNPKIDLDDKIKKLSGGQKQVINFSLCLAQKRDVYLLDEPLNNIDKEIKQKILKYLIETNKNFILVSHEPLQIQGMKNICISKRSFGNETY